MSRVFQIFIGIFTGLFLVFYFNGEKLNIKYALIYTCVLAAFFLLGEIRDLLAGQSTRKNIRSKKYDLLPFNDALAKEVMRIRTDLVSIRVKLKDYGGLLNHSDDFAKLFAICCNYPDTFLCTYIANSEHTKPSERYSGKIIIILDNELDMQDNGNFEFLATELRILNSLKKHTLSVGMHVSFFLEENQELWSRSFEDAKIISIEKNTNKKSFCYADYILTLELCHDVEYDFMTSPPEKEIRKVTISKNIYYQLFHKS